jgi:hypothetical protein
MKNESSGIKNASAEADWTRDESFGGERSSDRAGEKPGSARDRDGVLKAALSHHRIDHQFSFPSIILVHFKTFFH